MNLLNRLFGKGTSSKEIAKDRLRLVLVHDRSGIPPALLQTIRNELITVLSRHVRVDREGIVINVSERRGITRLVADIPIASPKPSRSGDPADRPSKSS